jgi:hypothetical protein
MKTNTEIKLAWEIWHLIARLNDLIWDLYENEFISMMEIKECTESELNEEDFPF